jgi:uncharacterized surface protein with fasciclin (FAS1) repeats
MLTKGGPKPGFRAAPAASKTNLQKDHESVYEQKLNSGRESMIRCSSHVVKFALLAATVGLALLLSHAVSAGTNPAPRQDIVDTAVAAGSFKTLASALQAAGLVETLKGKGPFTVFAPTDEAFAKLAPGTVEDLLKPENKEKLASILTYHVVSGEIKAAQVTTLHSAKTVNGQSLAVKVMDGKVMVDNARVIQTDILCSNGIIHGIDAVVLPK